ncbi:BadF/BadG/BcrA/BcrD ATPase family protein [Clostridium sp. AF29-8BH]|uniref:BadF/BadG/BcrA/BcrD ATPase family protein n=1 Tax=Clostridium sp. AF29-8BH TaxID=2293009 RepID=UPI001FAA203A
MNLSLGIDIGSSSTKAAALDEHGTLLGTLQVHADDPRTSAYGVLGRFLDQQGASFDDVEKIVLTGLGSTYFHENIFGIPTIHALELDAIGRGGLYLSGLDEALVVSLGTGSAFIRASKTNGFRHLGGSGVGGGTLVGMAERFLGVTDIFPSQRWRCAAIRPWQISALPTCRRKMSRDLPPT